MGEMMATVGFSGSRVFDMDNEHHLELVEPRLEQLLPLVATGAVTRIVSGAQRGLDQYVARWFDWRCPHLPNLIVVPRAPHDSALVRAWEAREGDRTHEIEYMPDEGLVAARAYRARDLRVVEHVRAGRGWLIAFPLREQGSGRSGTWTTVRMAQNACVPVNVTVLEPQMARLF